MYNLVDISIYGGKYGEIPSQQPLRLKSECQIYVFGEKPIGKLFLGKFGE